jgi:hypothetical protein
VFAARTGWPETLGHAGADCQTLQVVRSPVEFVEQWPGEGVTDDQQEVEPLAIRKLRQDLGQRGRELAVQDDCRGS